MTRHSLLIAASLLMVAPAFAHDGDTSSDVAFSDPGKPGTLKIRVLHGDITIHGDDVKEITVKSDSESARPTPRKDGMRVLSSNSGYQLTEKDNVAVLEYTSNDWSGGSSDFDITVPRSTSIVVANAAHGDIECEDISGDIDVRTVSGDVNLKDITGGALVETMNGEIAVHVKSLSETRPLSFTSMRGEISIVLPRDAKANVRFRTHRGVILTDFDDKSLVTRTEITKSKSDRRELHHADSGSGDRTSASPDAPPAPAADARPSAPAVAAVPAAPAAHPKDDDISSDVRESINEAALAAADAGREAAEAVREGLAEAHAQMSGIIAPLPPMTGGKVVSGKLNGGGAEIQAATLTGDIILKKSD